MNVEAQVRELRRRRPRSHFLRWNAAGVAILFVVAWCSLEVDWTDLFSSRRGDNIRRFFGEIYPFELRDRPFDVASLYSWVLNIWFEHGKEAALATFSISVIAIILAGLSALTAVFPAARNVACAEPFLPNGRSASASRRFAWSCVAVTTRASMIFARAIPEYIWAFLLIAIIGPSAWPAILALAIHNFGILGKLGAEVVEHVDPAAPRALRGQGLSRLQIGVVALLPMSLGKWLLFFFYRWETCIREATVLGMLGITSIGYWVNETRSRDWYDQMFLYIVLGALLVLVVDLLSALTRWFVRRA
jgi:phosphonate transport system permease protein